MMSDQLENITLSQLLKLKDPSEYEVLLYVKSKTSIKNPSHKRKPKAKSHYYAKPFIELTFSQVIEIRREINTVDGIFKAFEWVFGIERKELEKVKVLDFYPAWNHILAETRRCVENENALSKPDPKWKEAGGDQLNQFRESAPIINIAKEFSYRPMEVENWTYGEVFLIMSWNSIYHDVLKRYQKITAKKK